MRIGIDARELGGRATGVGRYLAGLLREWSTDGSTGRHEFLLYGCHPLGPGGVGAAGASDTMPPLLASHVRSRIVDGRGGTWWEQVRLPRIAAGDRVDLFFSPAYTAPLFTCVPVVATIHDLSYVAHPEWFRRREGVRRRWLTARTAARARAILTVSEFSRREIVDRLGVAPDRVHVVPQGIDRPRGAARADADREARVLYVGSIFNRRHVPDLVRAVWALAERRAEVSLDLVGDNRTYPYEDIETLIGSLRAERSVRLHRYVTDPLLQELYGRARVFAFLSEYEGLGMTPLEALAAGSVPVVADTAVARECYREAALYVPSGDIPAATHAIEAALFDPSTRARILGAAGATLARYDWARAARETLAVLEAAVPGAS